MNDILKSALGTKTFTLGVVRKLIEGASKGAATAIAQAMQDYKLTDETLVCRKSFHNLTQKVKSAERAIVHKIATGGIDLMGEVMLQSGAIKQYFNGVVLYVHDYGDKFLPIGKNVHLESKDGDLIGVTVFAKHKLADDLYQLYSDDIIFDGVNTGPICQDWSVDYIPLKTIRRGGTGWKEALSKAIKARPDIKSEQNKIQSIVTSWLLVTYSAAPIGTNPEVKTILEGKSFKSEALRLDVEHIEEPPAKKEDPPEEIEETPEAPEEKPEEQTPEVEDEKKLDDDGTPEPGGDVIQPPPEKDGEEIPEETETPAEEETITIVESVPKDDRPGEPVLLGKSIESITAQSKELEGIKGKGIAEAFEFMDFTVPIFSQIDEQTSNWIVNYLIALNLYKPEQEVTMIINSPGGYCSDGFAITDTMAYVQSQGTKIRTIGLGEICSMGLVIFMAGDSRFIGPNASILSHQFWGGAQGSAAELEASSVEWKNVKKRILDHYIKFSKYSTVEDVETNLLRTVDTWLTPKQAIKHGLADKILSESFKFVDPIINEEGDAQVAGKAMTGEVETDPEPEKEEVVTEDLEVEITDPETIKEAEEITAEIEEPQAETFTCECIKCNYTVETEIHCADLKCPECGGQMRRKERPGPGQGEVKDELSQTVEAEIDGVKEKIEALKNEMNGNRETYLVESGGREKIQEAIEKLSSLMDCLEELSEQAVGKDIKPEPPPIATQPESESITITEPVKELDQEAVVSEVSRQFQKFMTEDFSDLVSARIRKAMGRVD